MKRMSVGWLAGLTLLSSLAAAQPLPAQPSDPLAPVYQLPLAPPPLYAPPLGAGFRTVVDQHGQLVVERRTRLGRKGLWASGLAIFLATPVVAGAVLARESGTWNKSAAAGLAMFPVIGMFANAGIESDNYVNTDSHSGISRQARVAGWAVAGLVQASGLAMWMVGLGTGPEKIERFPLRFSAGPTANNGMQFGMNGKF